MGGVILKVLSRAVALAAHFLVAVWTFWGQVF